MTHLVLKKTLMKMTQMHSAIAVNIMTRKQLRFILERETITQVSAGLFQGIVMLEIYMTRLVLICILTVLITQFITVILRDI